jgi:hypothetical protein
VGGVSRYRTPRDEHSRLLWNRCSFRCCCGALPVLAHQSDRKHDKAMLHIKCLHLPSQAPQVPACVGTAAAGVLGGAWHGFAVAPRRTSSSAHAIHVCATGAVGTCAPRRCALGQAGLAGVWFVGPRMSGADARCNSVRRCQVPRSADGAVLYSHQPGFRKTTNSNLA